ncbi:alkene reductase [Erythrobacter arachoides]|uniref:Alkene reductase n=1 Tax=Aurantiacibacter arachoides TaxID=1850444 RepID=A0A844ZYQ3_9SPHN|nr:alkene reductase [Aurantiacibacter arachoides]MXO92066.1 alkene reductase [Aurantiacibacter arachoides]GGD60031.1 alkene reductase [Aurantiacibacter arachoides]
MTDRKPSKPDLSPLFDSVTLGAIEARNRIVMAPLTRARSERLEATQTGLHALYYAQRAGAGLIVSEATQISRQGQGYAWTPGIFTAEQVESWKPVTDAVHNAGGRIVCQLWHVGAVSHPVFQPDEGQPVSSSAWTPEGEAFVGDRHPDGPQVPFTEARAITLDEIEGVLEDYHNAARCAAQAGFDGVELHAANGYLIDQFMRTGVNRREDDYGGSLDNRLRLLGQAVEAITAELPADRVGVRLTPIGGAGGSADENPAETYPAAAKLLAGRGLAYLHTVRATDHGGADGEKSEGDAIIHAMRKAFDGTFIANGNFTPEQAARWIAQGHADAVAFGRLFIANPDLPGRIAAGGPYNEPDPATFYGGGMKGYTDYPSLEKVDDPLPC